MVRYISPVNPAVYPHLAVTLLSIGLFFMAWFFVYPHTQVMYCQVNEAEASVHMAGLALSPLKWWPSLYEQAVAGLITNPPPSISTNTNFPIFS